MYLNLQSMMLWNEMAPKGNLWVFPNLVEKNTLLCFICITFKTMPMTDKGQTGWYIFFYWRWNLGEQWFKGLCLCLKIAFKTLLQTLWSLESPLVLVLHLWVLLIVVSQGKSSFWAGCQLHNSSSARDPRGPESHSPHPCRETEWPGDKGEDLCTWRLAMLKTTQQWNQTARESRRLTFSFLPRATVYSMIKHQGK